MSRLRDRPGDQLDAEGLGQVWVIKGSSGCWGAAGGCDGGMEGATSAVPLGLRGPLPAPPPCLLGNGSGTPQVSKGQFPSSPGP